MGPNFPRRAAPTVPTLADPAIDAARQAELSAGNASYGRQQTILTSGQGAPQTASVLKKTLLGA